jgi:hypothetical protein
MLPFDIILKLSAYLELKHFNQMFSLSKEKDFNNTLYLLLLIRKMSRKSINPNITIEIKNKTNYSWKFLSYFDNFISNKIKSYQNVHLIGLNRIRVNDNYELYYNGENIGGNRCVVGNFPLVSKNFFPFIGINTEIKQNIHIYHLFKSFVSYFEITIKGTTNQAESECISIGICNNNFPLFGKQPGWDSNSYGYHGDDGQIFHNHNAKKGKPFGADDNIGCGIQYIDGNFSIFFTKNGNLLEELYEIKNEGLTEFYPVIAIDSFNKVNVNFGKKPFCFDLQNYNIIISEKNTNKQEVSLKNKKKYFEKLSEDKIKTINYLYHNPNFTQELLEGVISNESFIFYPDLVYDDEIEDEQITDN